MFSNTNGNWRHPLCCESLGKPLKGLYSGSALTTSPPHPHPAFIPLPLWTHQPQTQTLINHWGWASTLGLCPVCPGLITDCQCHRRVKPILLSSLGTELRRCLALMPTLHKPTLSTLHSSTTCASVCVLGAQIHNPLLRDLPLINKLPFQFMFISSVCVVTPIINYTQFLALVPYLFFLLSFYHPP